MDYLVECGFHLAKFSGIFPKRAEVRKPDRQKESLWNNRGSGETRFVAKVPSKKKFGWESGVLILRKSTYEREKCNSE